MPLGGERLVLGRNLSGNLSIPAREGVTLTLRVSRCFQGCVVVLCLHNIVLTVTKDECHRVLVHLPLRREGLIASGNRCRDLGIPARERVASLHQVSGSLKSSTVVLCLHHIILAVAQHKGHLVLIDLPLSRERLITGRNGSRHSGRPAGEGIALALRVGRSCQLRTTFLSLHDVGLAIT